MSNTRPVQHFEIPPYGHFDYHGWNHPCEAEKFYDKNVIDYYARFVKYGSVAIDIGAHTGDTALPMALAGFKETIALEPNPHVFEILKVNAEANLHLNIVPVCAAIIEPPGQYTFHYGSDFCNGGYKDTDDEFAFPNGEPIEVRGVSLIPTFNFIADTIGFIKIDTEGHDRHVLESLMPIKDKLVAAIQIEVYGGLNENGVRKLEETIDRLGYKMYTANELTPVKSCIKSGIWPNGIATDLILLRD